MSCVLCDLSGQQINTNARHIAITVIINPFDLHKRYLSLLLSLASVHFCTDELVDVAVHHGTIDSYDSLKIEIFRTLVRG